jgi:hypothetical protein
VNAKRFYEILISYKDVDMSNGTVLRGGRDTVIVKEGNG